MKCPICRTVAHIAPAPGQIVKLFATGVTHNHKILKIEQPQRNSARPMGQTSKSRLSRQFLISWEMFQTKASRFVEYQHFQHLGVPKLGNLVKKNQIFSAIRNCYKSLLAKCLNVLDLTPRFVLKGPPELWLSPPDKHAPPRNKLCHDT